MRSARWRRHVALVLTVAAAGVALGGVIATVQAPEYRATAGLFVEDSTRAVIGEPDPGGFRPQVADSYGELATTPMVLGRVVHHLGLRVTAGQLAQHVEAERTADSDVISVSVTEGSRASAASIANEVVDQVAAVATSLTPSSEANRVHVTALPVSRNVLQTEPDLLRGVGVGLLGGVLLAALLVLVRERDAVDEAVLLISGASHNPGDLEIAAAPSLLARRNQ